MAMPSANCGFPKLAKKGKSIGKNYAISARTFPKKGTALELNA